MKKNPIVFHTFTPSYEADSQEEYDAKVASGRKPSDHSMVKGGRRAVRYGEGIEKETPETRARKLKRWAERTQPWDARTQSLKAHEASAFPPNLRTPEARERALTAGLLEPYEDQIRDGLLSYMEAYPNAFGLVVPTSWGTLAQFGVPAEAAKVLVQRSAGCLIPNIDPASLERLTARPTLEALFVGSLGVPLRVSPEEGIFIERVRRGRARNLRFRLYLVDLLGERRKRRILTTEANLRAAIDRVADNLIRSGIPEADVNKDKNGVLSAQILPVFFEGLRKDINVITRSARRGWKGRVDLRLVFRGVNIKGRETQFARLIPVGEHSILQRPGARATAIQYKTLRNLTLSELPATLARISRREEKAPTSPFALGNPLANDALLKTVVSEYEQGRLVSVPGKPGKVYWPVSEGSKNRKRYVGVKITTENRAKSWLAIAIAGKRNKSNLSQAAKSEMQKEGLAPINQLAGSTAKENPMAHDDEMYWFEQYQRAPFGARRSVPTARRNPKKRKKSKARKNPEAAEAMRLYHSGAAPSLKAAWQMVKSNPGYPPAMVPMKHHWSDPTMIKTSLANPHPFMKRRGQFSTSQTFGIQPVNRRNPRHSALLNPMVNKFNPELACCMCGGHIPQGGEMVVHPTMKGPRGGKKYCHPHCA